MISFNKKKRAFTLVELLVVILIIAILIAVAAPSFLGQQDKAKDSAVKQSLTVVRKNLKTVWMGGGPNGNDAYATTSAGLVTQLEEAEPQYQFVADSGATETLISVSRVADDQAIACQQSASGTFFCLLTNENGSSYIQASTALFGVDEAHADATTFYSAGATEVDAQNALDTDPGNNGTGVSGWANTPPAPQDEGGEQVVQPTAADQAAYDAAVSFATSYNNALRNFDFAGGDSCATNRPWECIQDAPNAPTSAFGAPYSVLGFSTLPVEAETCQSSNEEIGGATTLQVRHAMNALSHFDDYIGCFNSVGGTRVYIVASYAQNRYLNIISIAKNAPSVVTLQDLFQAEEAPVLACYSLEGYYPPSDNETETNCNYDYYDEGGGNGPGPDVGIN